MDKIIKIENKSFELCKVGAFGSLEIMDNVIATIIKGNNSLNEDDKAGISQIINNIMQTGAKEANELQVAKVLDKFGQDNTVAFAINLFKGSIANVSFKEKVALFDSILAYAKLSDKPDLHLSCSALDSELSSGMSIIQLCFAVLRFNFSFLQADGK